MFLLLLVSLESLSTDIVRLYASLSEDSRGRELLSHEKLPLGKILNQILFLLFLFKIKNGGGGGGVGINLLPFPSGIIRLLSLIKLNGPLTRKKIFS